MFSRRLTGDDLMAQALICVVNVQHDCATYQCHDNAQEVLQQEREDTTRTRTVVSHKEDKTFILNLHAVHNCSYLQQALPTALQNTTTPFTDREELLRNAARSLRDQKLQKKLAKDATARKHAEDALHSANGLGGQPNVLLDEELDENNANEVSRTKPLLHGPDRLVSRHSSLINRPYHRGRGEKAQIFLIQTSLVVHGMGIWPSGLPAPSSLRLFRAAHASDGRLVFKLSDRATPLYLQFKASSPREVPQNERQNVPVQETLRRYRTVGNSI